MAVRMQRKIVIFVVIILVLIFSVNLPVYAGSFAAWSSMSSGTTSDLYGIWGSDNSSVFAAGNSGTIVSYNGSTWSLMSAGTTKDLDGVWGSDGNDIFVVGNSGTILHFDGSAWSSMSSGTTSDLHGIWGADSTDVFAVGSSGTIQHYNGSTWSSISGGTTKDLDGVWGSDGNDIFAVGNSGTILHYDGSAWSAMNSGTTKDLEGIWGDGANIFVVGNSGTFLHYDGFAWSAMNSGTASDLYGIWGSDGSDIFVVGSYGTIEYYDGSKFSPMNRGTINKLSAVWGFSSNDVFIAGESGTILNYLPPVIKSISQGRGYQGETLDVILTGANLTGASDVRLGTGIAVNNFTILSANQITANITIVAGAATGARDVSVTTAGGSFTLPNSFTVEQALPTISSISPQQDRQAATLKMTITGTNLSGTSEVRLGTGIAVDSFTILSANQIAVEITIAAEAETGARDVSVTTPGGSFTLPGSFTIQQALPVITSISLQQGNQENTMDITIAGTNLSGASEVRIGTGIVVNSFTVLSSNQIASNISIAAGAKIGARDVSVTTPGGSFTLPNSFTVKQALPTITSISPDQGSQSATLNITITGTNFGGASEVRLGTGIAVNSFTVLSANQIAANITIVGGAATGVGDVLVTTPGGSFTLPNSFTVKQALPAIASISPNQGNRGATLEVIISGSNLDGATSASFGSGVAVESFSNISSTQLRVNIMIDAEAVTGARDISVTTPGGSSTLGNSFNVNERSLGTLIVALIWVGIAVVVVLFIIILNILRKKRAANV